jgi:hypothetical protein
MNNQSDNLYYFRDGTRVHSKLLAIEYETIKREECRLYYHDHLYDAVDWKTEPLLSLNDYYVEQAKRIREAYDYVILCYSGGIDSTNILETFHFNNIKLDKILSVGALSQDSYVGDDTNHNGELYYNVFPYIQDLGLKNIFQVLDYTKHFPQLKSLSVAQHKSWIEETGSWFSPHHWVWKDIHDYVVPFEMRNKKVAIIFGRDKPSLSFDGDGYYFSFMDAVLNSYGFYKGRDNIDVINFYWDPTFPQILVKQLHVIKRHQDLQKNLNLRFDKDYMVQYINGLSIHELIYDIKRPLKFVSKKSQSTILSLRDTYLKNAKNSDVYDMFSSGVREIRDRLGNITIPHRYSKRYYIT